MGGIVNSVANVFRKTIGTVVDAIGLGAPEIKMPEAPKPAAPIQNNSIQSAEAAKEVNAETEAAKKKTASKGKGTLSITRSAGRGLNT